MDDSSTTISKANSLFPPFLFVLFCTVGCTSSMNYGGKTIGSFPEVIGAVPALPANLPRPSAKYIFDKDNLGFEKVATLGALDKKIRSVLQKSCYKSFQYYETLTGYALVTQIERIQKDGEPFKEPYRWVNDDLSSPSPPLEFSYVIRALFSAQPGFYRVLLFKVSHRDEVTIYRDDPTTVNDAISIVGGGVDYLPTRISERSFTDDFIVTTLVYEFFRPDIGEAPEITKLGIGVNAHLSKTNVHFGGHSFE